MTGNAASAVHVQPETTLLRVAVTGHRHFPDAATTSFVTRAISATLQHLLCRYPDGLCALSGLAEGTDSIFAEIALHLHIPLESIIAADDLSETFPPGPARSRYLLLRQRSQTVHTLPFRHAGPPAYIALGRALVDNADLLVAAWDGRPAPDPGGTGGVVAYARACGRPVIHLHTVHHTITGDQQRKCSV